MPKHVIIDTDPGVDDNRSNPAGAGEPGVTSRRVNLRIRKRLNGTVRQQRPAYSGRGRPQ